MYNKARLNANEFFSGNEDCIIKKSSSFSRSVDLIPSDYEYPIILKEAQNQIDKYVAECNPYACPDYKKMTNFVNHNFKNLNYIGGSITGNTMTLLNVTKMVKVNPWLFIYKGISYFAYVSNGLIYSITIFDERICSSNFFGNTECYLDDKTTLESIHEKSIKRALSNKSEEIKKFRKQLHELRKIHYERMNELNDALNGRKTNYND